MFDTPGYHVGWIGSPKARRCQRPVRRTGAGRGHEYGDTALCPHLVFAARTPQSRHRDAEFLVGNILQAEIADPHDRCRLHERYQVGATPTCGACALNSSCGKGCPAAVVAAGEPVGWPDTEQCPPEDVRRLPLISAEQAGPGE